MVTQTLNSLTCLLEDAIDLFVARLITFILNAPYSDLTMFFSDDLDPSAISRIEATPSMSFMTRNLLETLDLISHSLDTLPVALLLLLRLRFSCKEAWKDERIDYKVWFAAAFLIAFKFDEDCEISGLRAWAA